MTKVAKALVIAEQGKLLDFKGKTFDELTADEIEPKEDEDTVEIEEDDDSDKESVDPPPR